VGVFTVLFTIEYFLRIFALKKPFKYIFSFFGIVDLIALLPNYLSLFSFGAQSLLVIRSFRLLRIFPNFQIGKLFAPSQGLTDCSPCQSSENYSFFSRRSCNCFYSRGTHAPYRRRSERLHEYTDLSLLGNNDHDDCGLWRHCTTNSPWSGVCFNSNDIRLWGIGSAYLYYVSGNSKSVHKHLDPILPILRATGPRSRCPFLQILRSCSLE
jgi:hypothetical protein